MNSKFLLAVPAVAIALVVSALGSKPAAAAACDADTAGTSLAQCSFETPALSAGSLSYNPTGSAWTFSTGSGLASNGSAFSNPAAPDGTQVAFIQGTGTVSQSISGWQSGTAYTLTLSAARRGNGVGNNDVKILVDATALGTFKPRDTTYTDWSVNFTTTAGTHTLEFLGLDSVGGDNTAFIDDVRLDTAAAATPCTHAAGTTITQCGFESPAMGSGNAGYANTTADSWSVGTMGTVWNFSGSGAGIAQNSNVYPSSNPVAPEGTQVAFIQGTGSASQSVSGFQASTVYTLTVAAARRVNNGGNEDVKVTLDGTTIGTFKPRDTTYTDWSVNFSTTAGTHAIGFTGIDSAGGDNTALIDNLRLDHAAAPVACASAAGTSLTQCGFETPALGSGNVGFAAPAADGWSVGSMGTAWTLSGGGAISTNGSLYTNGNPAAPEGTQVGLIQTIGTISQSVSGFRIGAAYVLTVSAAGRTNYGYNDLAVQLGNLTVATFTPNSASYSDYTVRFTATATTQTLTFSGLDSGGGDRTTFIDNIRLNFFTLTGGSYAGSQTYGQGGGSCPCAGLGRQGDPVNTATGNFTESSTDISIAGRSYPLAFSRTYNSATAATSGPLGYGWQLGLGMSLSGTNGNPVTITQEDASTVDFTYSAGTYTPLAPRYIAILTWNSASSTWTFKRRNRDTYTFNSSGQLTQVTDLNGYQTTYSYTGGNLSSVADPGGRALTIAWTSGKIGSVTDANVTPNRTVTLQYNDGNGNLTDVIDVLGGHTQFTYDTAHRITVIKDPNCYSLVHGGTCPGIQLHYDANGRVDWQKDQLNRQTSFDYTSIVGGTKTTDPRGNVVVDYFTDGMRTAETKGYGTSSAATWTYSYDNNTMALLAETDPLGHTTRYTVDSNGNTLTKTDPLNHLETWTYNSLNQVLTDQDPNGVTTTYTYDSSGNLTKQSRPLNGSTNQAITYAYTDASHPGDVITMTDADGKVWTYHYDANGYRDAVTDPLSNKNTYVYNGDGFKTSMVTPLGNVTGCGCASQYTASVTYDAAGDVLSTTDALGHGVGNAYDKDRNLSSTTDPDSHQTSYTYDYANERTVVTRADTTTLVTDYFSDGTVQDQKDGKNNAILTYGYDALARVASTTDALNNVTSFTYDGAGNELTKQDPGGNCGANPQTGCTTLTYDAANELKSITYSDGVTPNVTNITYDGDGQRTGMTDGTGTSNWVLDNLHRLTSYTNGNGAQVQYSYNLRNLPTTITYPGSLNVIRGYDDAGRWTSVQDWLSNTTSFGYDGNSNLTTDTLPSGAGVVDTFGYDAADRLMSISDVKGGTTTVFGATYTRDNANQLVSDSSTPAATGAYKYTTLNQVCYAGSSSSSACSSPPSGATAYAYDPADNLTQMTSTQQVFNGADQLCWTAATSGSCASPPSGATTYSYDTRGNRTMISPPSGGATTLSYDQANRLTGYGSSAIYAYNGDGLRMSKTVSGTTSQFLWDVTSNVPLLIKDGSTAYIDGPTGLPSEQINGSTALWLHHDQLGSIRLATDASGSNQATYTFDAYGKVTATSGTIANPFGFAGQYRDAESSLYYLRARYYDPATAQFLSRDPAVAANLEPYAYVRDNPLNATDPSGLFGWDDLKHIANGVVHAPFAVAHSVVLNVESVVSTAFYAPYWGAYHVNKDWWPNAPQPVKSVMSGVQRGGLWLDKGFDSFQQWSGYPGATQNDEAQTVNYFPSAIYPTFDCNGDWHQNKFVYGQKTYGPGRGPNGHEDYAD